MSWITIVWSMNAGACFVLAGVCFVVWCKQRESWPHLLFSCSAVAAGVIALIELTMLHANTVGQYTALVRRSEEHTSELQSQSNIVCRLLLEKKKCHYRFHHSNRHMPASDIRHSSSLP